MCIYIYIYIFTTRLASNEGRAKNLSAARYISFRKTETFSVYSSHIVQKIYYSATFQLQFVQDLLRMYNWWNLQSSPCVTSLNTSIPNIYAVIPSILYLVYRVSLQISCVFGVELGLKEVFIYW